MRSILPLVALCLGCAAPRSTPLAASFTGTKPAVVVSSPAKVAAASPPVDPVEEARAVHALSRFAFGPRPSDVERVAKMGVDAWLRAQLAPGSDPAVDAKVARLRATKLSTKELLDAYPKGKGGDGTPADLERELATAKVVRAVESERQLEEVLVDFWFNHFNVDAKKGAVKWLVAPYEREAIRAHVFGKFRDLLGATAKHPAMLFYLDNWRSAASSGKPKGKKPSGLNENYARELLELHTLGVDGGYTQDDVKEVARAFTGWTIDKPKEVGAFVFRPGMHDAGAKKVLGKTIDVGGIGDGEAVLDLVATHAATAHHLSLALARRFVSDDPPSALVDQVAKVFLTSNGDLRKTYEALFFAPEAWSDAAKKSKVKDPFETVVSSIRAVGGTFAFGEAGNKKGLAGPVEPLLRTLEGLGEPIYHCAPPTGFPERATAWVGTGALVSRIRFAVALSEDRFRVGGAGVVWDPHAVVPDGKDPLVDRVARALLHAPLAAATRTAIQKELDAMPDEPDEDSQRRRLTRAIGLVLGSPDFQRQ